MFGYPDWTEEDLKIEIPIWVIEQWCPRLKNE